MPRTLSVSSAAIPVVLGRPALEPVRLSGHEGLNGLFAYELFLKTPDVLGLSGVSSSADFDLDAFIGREISCEIELDGSPPRQLNALITDAALWGEEGRHVQYKLTLRPWLHLATLRTDCRIFQNLSVVQILDALLSSYAFPVDKRLIEHYPLRDYQTQFNESDFAFFCRLCQEWGISYHFEHSDGKHRLVLSDAMGAYGAGDVLYEQVEYHAPGWKIDAEYIHSFVPAHQLTSGKYATRDYDYTRPRADLGLSRADPRPTGQADGEVYQWHASAAGGSHYAQPNAGAGSNSPQDEGRLLSLLRMQALRTHGARAQASGNLRGMVPGCTFQLMRHPRESANAEYLILDTRFLIEDVAEDSQNREANPDRKQQWRVQVSFTAHPVTEPLRPEPTQPKPAMVGPQVALVVGPEGQNLWTDELGRIKVQFPWDRLGEKNQHSSCWVRVVDQHLRVVDLASKQEAEQAEGSTRTGTLFGDGTACAAAKPCIKAWLVGPFRPGALVSDRHGRPFATIAPAAAQIYTKVQDVYEIELDLSAPPFADLQAPGAMKSFAWMIRLGTEDRRLEAFKGVKYAEAQDLAIARFLQQQATRDPWHFDKLYEFAMPPPDVPFSWSKPGQRPELDTLLKSWHPVKRMTKPHLKLGHLSDVHINMRQNAMGRSDAKVLEEADEKKAAWNRPVGSKVCNSFEALKKLLETMATGTDRVDAVLLTGDLIDYNRNFNPMAEPGGPGRIGEQWKAFNLLGNVFDKEKGRRLYPRGLDDMMVFSLVREMYRNPAYQLPIIMTSGNHEAYQVPYGISARVEAGDRHNWAFMLGVLETTTPNSRDARKRMEENARTSWPDGNVPAEARRAQRALAQPDAVERHRAQFDAASAWTRGKANEGMSRDHNMTIYEACLAYGPTYGHALTGYNFDGGQFDWFYALFTPLADVVYAYGAESTDKPGAKAGQVIAALGWGIDENFKNLLGVAEAGVDRQGSGILPRATESFSQDQLKLLAQARSYKAASKGTLTVATHFTIVSFDEPEPFSNLTKKKDRVFFHPCDGATGIWGMKAALNHVNVGTCEKNQATYLAQYVQPMDQAKASPTPKVDWHLSGHSHRSGVYKLGWNPRSIDTSDGWRVEVREAKDPGIHKTQTVKPNTVTALIVSSCGGPIGYQNLDGELSAWTGRPPAGTTLDPTTGEIRQVKTDRCHTDDEVQRKGFNEKPRLAVALDYLHAMSGLPKKGNIRVPLRFKPGYFGKSGQLELVLSEQVRKLGCVEEVKLWVFQKNSPKRPDGSREEIKTWHPIVPGLIGTTLSFKDEDRAMLLSMMSATTASSNGALAMAWSPRSVVENYPNTEYVMLRQRLVQAFCEVTLKEPSLTDAGENWGKDVLHADPWVFPLEIALIDGNVNMGEFSLDKSNPARPKNAVWHFGRPMGERGEVPDWDFLFGNFASKGYVDKKSAIWVNKDPVR